jgi:hypothetical protein
MLRNVLTQMPGVGTWPCDEINYIWRHGNARYPNDEFTADMATRGIRSYIRKQFDWVADRYDAHIVVEKTCANSLRVAFVESILRSPKYVFIHRNGVDAVSSAMQRWHADVDPQYILDKARFVPVMDLPLYAFRYVRNRLSRSLSVDGNLSMWGPITAEMREQRRDLTLAELCASQWSACVERALEAFENIAPARVLRISYEGLIEDRFGHATRLAQFLDVDANTMTEAPAFTDMSAESIGKGRQLLDSGTIDDIVKIAGPALSRLGYR